MIGQRGQTRQDHPRRPSVLAQILDQPGQFGKGQINPRLHRTPRICQRQPIALPQEKLFAEMRLKRADLQ